MSGKFVMVEGLDGSGKGVAVNALKEWAASQNMKILDLREYWKENEGFPNIDKYDAIISAEPTFTGTGKKIREEMIKNGSKYSAKEIAEAFSEQRKELYEKIIIPARKAGKFIFQERGVVTSIAYQPLMENGYTVEEIKELEGNKLCIENAPDLLIITVVKPEVVIERLGKRKKQDDAIFEQLEFQKKAEKVYESEWLKKLFEEKGSKVVFLDTNPPKTVEDTKKKAVEIFENLMSSS
jgi:thymidylate kinase